MRWRSPNRLSSLQDYRRGPRPIRNCGSPKPKGGRFVLCLTVCKRRRFFSGSGECAGRWIPAHGCVRRSLVICSESRIGRSATSVNRRQHTDIENRSRSRLCRATFVPVVEAADFGQRHDAGDRTVGRRPTIRRVFLETEMRAAAMVVAEVRRQDAAQMRGVQDDQLIETLATNGSDQPFDERVLPGTCGTGHDLCDRHAGHAALERVAVNAVSIAWQPAWGSVVRKRFDDLLSRPFSGWVRRYVEMREAAAFMRQHE